MTFNKNIEMKNFRNLAVMGILSLIAHLGTAQSMNIKSNIGNTSTIDLSTVESIVFRNNNIVVNKTDCGDNYFNLLYSKKITFNETIEVDEVNLPENTIAIAIFPNPVTNTLSIDTRLDAYSNANIISSNGVILKSFEITDQHHKIDISTLPSGLYFIKIDDQTSKFIKR